MDDRDLTALIGILAVLEGEMTPHLADRIRDRLERAALLAPGGSEGELRRALGDLNQRLRHALGERDEPPRA